MPLTAGQQFLHWEIDAGPSDSVEVTLDHAANVQLMDESNFSAYKSGSTYHYAGGYITKSPFRIAPPHQGRWHLVVDLGGAPGTVKASARVLYGR